jgi:hypothetical protein
MKLLSLYVFSSVVFSSVTAQNCADPGQLPNGGQLPPPSSPDGYAPGDELFFFCNDGYMIEDKACITCGGTSGWLPHTPTEPSCVSNTSAHKQVPDPHNCKCNIATGFFTCSSGPTPPPAPTPTPLNTFDCKLDPAGGFKCEVAQGKSGDYNSSSDCEAHCHAPTPPPTPTYNCGFEPPSTYQCIEATGKSGMFNSSAACQANCTAPTPCTGSSHALPLGECIWWMNFFEVTGGTDWRFCNSNRTDPCACNTSSPDPHRYINCSNGHITDINLDCCGLKGSMPTDFNTLSQLTSLTLSSNSLAGQVPSSLSKLTALTALKLFGNLLTGIIAGAAIPQLRRLRI